MQSNDDKLEMFPVHVSREFGIYKATIVEQEKRKVIIDKLVLVFGVPIRVMVTYVNVLANVTHSVREHEILCFLFAFSKS